MEVRIFRRSRLELIFGVVGCFAAAVFCYWLLSATGSPERRGDLQLIIAGWVLFSISAAAAVFLAPVAFFRRIDIEIDSEGFQDHLSFCPKVLWSDVSEFEIDEAMTSTGSHRLNLTLKHSETLSKYIPWWARAFPIQRNRAKKPILTFPIRDDAALIMLAIEQVRTTSQRATGMVPTHD